MEKLKSHDYQSAILGAKNFLKGVEPKRIYSRWGEDLEDFRVKLSPDSIFQLGWEHRGRGRWFADLIVLD